MYNSVHQLSIFILLNIEDLKHGNSIFSQGSVHEILTQKCNASIMICYFENECMYLILSEERQSYFSSMN